MASAVEAFKAQYGSYPPTNLSCPGGVANANLQAFVAREFPRYYVATSLGAQIASDLAVNNVDTMNVNPQAALVFWLQGFNPDVTDPFNRNLLAVNRKAFFTFDTTRLVYSNTNGGGSIGSVANVTTSSPIGNLAYNAPYGNTPYAYFDSAFYGATPTGSQAYSTVSPGPSNPDGPVYLSTSSSSTTLFGNPAISIVISSGSGYLSPYFADANNNGSIDLGEGFAKPTSFQIISAGQDGIFGTSNATNASYFRLYPIGVGYDSSGGDNDNITNFCERNNLDAAKP